MIFCGNFSSLYGDYDYWRVFCADNWGDASIIELQEVEFLDGSGNVIPATGGAAIKSDDATGNEAAKAFDGNSATNWAADSGNTNQWIGYQFPSPQGVEKVRITTRASGVNFLARMPKSCSLQHSTDGLSWTTAFSFHSVSLAGGSVTYPLVLAAGAHRYWRVFMSDNNGGTSFIILDEIELRATAGGADQVPAMVVDNNGTSTNRVIGSSIVTAGGQGWRAFDDITTSANPWVASGNTNQWIGVVSAAGRKVEEILLKCGATTNDRNRAPRNMTVDYSDDQTTWTVQKTLAAQTAWASQEIRVLAAI